MPVYTYRGTNRVGSSVSGEVTATSKADLQNILRRQQITATKMSEKGKEFNLPTFGAKVKPKELAVFTRQFSVMIDAGLPLVQCLEILAGQQENKLFQKVLTGTRSAVEGGATLSAAMRQFPKVFDALYVNMVEAGETGGILDTILQRLSQYIEKNVKLQRAVKSALVYPVGVLTIAAGVIVLLLWKVAYLCDPVRGLGRGVAAAHSNRHRREQFNRQLLRTVDPCGRSGPDYSHESLVWHSARPVHHRRWSAEGAGHRHFASKNRGGAIHANPRNSNLQRRAHPGGPGYYRQDGGECGGRKGFDESEKSAGRR